MKKRISKLFSLVLTAVFLISIPCTNVMAAEEIETVDENVVELETFKIDVPENLGISLFSTVFSDTMIAISYSSEGMLTDFYASMNKIASVVGVKDIKIQKKVLFGWKTVGTSSGTESNNCLSMGCGVRYLDAVKGETYRAVCTFYADVDGYRELYCESDGFVCSY